MLRLAGAVLAAVCALGTGTASAKGLDLFPGGTPRAPVSLNPFRVASAPNATTTAAADPATPTPTPTGPAAATAATPAPTTAAPTPAPKVCSRDEDCPAENICQNGTCQAIQRRTNILYLYYREGTFLEILGLYWSKGGSTGYNVLVPFYWHFWSPSSRSRVVAPFFWRFEDFAAQRTLTVIVPGLPISWSSQPDAKSFGIWPLFYLSTKFGWAAPLLGSFTIGDPDHGQAFGSLLFLYWWKRAPQRSLDALIPLFVASRTPDKSWAWAAPLNFYWREKDDANLLALPLFYWNAHKTGGSIYALTGYRKQEGPASSGALFWLYWFGSNEADKSRYDVLFPWLWSFRSPSSTTFIAPPIFHVRREGWHLSSFLPLYWAGGDDVKGETFRTLLPLFYWQTTDHGKRALLLLPIGGYSRNDDDSSRTLAMFPFIFSRSDPDGSLQAVTPLFIRWWNKREASTTNLIAFILYTRGDPRGSTTILFPLYWRFRDAPSDSSATVLFPFFAYRSGPQDTTAAAGVFPIWAYKRSYHEGGWSAGLFPLAFFGSRGESGHGVVFPLFWHFKSADSSTTALLPLFYTHADRHGSDTGILPLLTFFGDDQSGDKYRVQFPLFWRFISAREQTTSTVTPVGFYRTTRDGYSLGVGPIVPIVYAGRAPGRSHFGILPLFWHSQDDSEQRTTTVVLSYMHRNRGEETTDALYPLLYYRRGARPGGSPETSFTLFPLFHYRRNQQELVVLSPIGAASKKPGRDMGFVGPFFWYKRPGLEARGLLPIALDVTNGETGERTRQYGPYFQVDGPGRKSRVLFPFFGRYDDDKEHDLYLFPTYFRQRMADGYELDTFVPLFWRSKWQGRTTTVIGPWYNRSGPDVHNTGFFPIYFYAKNNQRSITVVPPLLLYRRADFQNGTGTLIALFTYATYDRESSSTVLFPLWWAGRERNQSHRVLFPIYWSFTDGDANSDMNLLGPIFWRHKGDWYTRGILPIVWYTRNPKDGSGSNALMPLFYESHGPNRKTLLTLLGGYSNKPTSRTWYILIVGASDGIETRFRMLFPLWFSHINKGKEVTTRVIPPVLGFMRKTPESSLETFLALYWHRRTIASELRLVLPLYYDIHDLHQSRTTVLFPLLFRHHNEEEQTTFWIAPLFYRSSNPADTSTVFFPLYWSFTHADGQSTTLLFPLYAHWRRPTYQSTYVFPTYYYREGLGPKGPDGTWRRLIVPFWESAVKRPGDYMWEVLGGLFGRESIGRNRYLKIFFMTFETQAATPAQTSWYGQPARTPRKAAPRGLSSSAW